MPGWSYLSIRRRLKKKKKKDEDELKRMLLPRLPTKEEIEAIARIQKELQEVQERVQKETPEEAGEIPDEISQVHTELGKLKGKLEKERKKPEEWVPTPEEIEAIARMQGQIKVIQGSLHDDLPVVPKKIENVNKELKKLKEKFEKEK